jgi:hypothetical protein
VVTKERKERADKGVQGVRVVTKERKERSDKGQKRKRSESVTPILESVTPITDSNFFLVLSDFWYYIFILLLKSRALLCRIIVQLYTFLFLCSPSQCLLNLYYFIFILCLFLFISKFFIFSDLFLFILSIFFERLSTIQKTTIAINMTSTPQFNYLLN